MFYIMLIKSKKTMNEMLNFSFKNEKIELFFLKTVNSTVFSVFIIWKKNKLRIIIGLRKINAKSYLNVYFFSKQNVILSLFDESKFFFPIDFTKKFYQQNIKFKYYWKMIFVFFHKILKWLTIFNMKLKNTFDFFQNYIKKIFELYL